MSQPTSKKFGKSTREVPHHSQKAQKWYPADDESQPKSVSGNFFECIVTDLEVRRCLWGNSRILRSLVCLAHWNLEACGTTFEKFEHPAIPKGYDRCHDGERDSFNAFPSRERCRITRLAIWQNINWCDRDRQGICESTVCQWTGPSY
jgi:hypothetical protein